MTTNTSPTSTSTNSTSTNSTLADRATSTSMVQSIVRGVLGGLAGGIVFGMLMQMMGMIEMVAMLVGSEAAGVGWVVHLAISAFIGASFGVLLGSRVTSLGSGLMMGAGYGLVWWVLGALIAMPAQLGMPLLQINDVSLKSLMGHLIFGLILGAVVAVLARRR